ncbi:MAG: flagellar motor switch protein FliN [Bdellovibrionota bacterium]
MNEPKETMPEMETSAAIDRAAATESNDKIAQILDIPLKVSVELGRARMLVQDLLDLHKGSVLELNKLAGEPLEVLVNDKIVARGEVVVVNEKFGIRLTDIVSHTERIRQLGENG